MSTARPVTITTMRRRHLPGVLAIEAAVYPRPWSTRLFEGEMDRDRRIYLVAREGASVLGYGGVLMIADDGHISTMAVDPAHQRRGLARRLLVELVRGARQLGATQLTLEVRASNQGAQSLYRSFGFAPGGVRKAYYPDNHEDALVMWAHDVDTDAYTARLDALAAMGEPVVVEVDDDLPDRPAVEVAHPALAARRDEHA